MQKEVCDIKDWHLQELLHRLLRAEARVAERTNASGQNVWKRKSPIASDPSVDNGKSMHQSLHDKGKSNRGGTKGTVELELKTVKCYKCHKDGHIAKSYPNAQTTKPGNKMITLESYEPEEETTI